MEKISIQEINDLFRRTVQKAQQGPYSHLPSFRLAHGTVKTLLK